MVTDKVPDVSITWSCYRCGFPVADGKGRIRVLAVEYHAHAAHQAGRGDGARSLADVLAGPDPARWLPAHFDCEDEDGDLYSLAVEEVRSMRELAWWTAHLMQKTWMPDTDWADVALRVAS